MRSVNTAPWMLPAQALRFVVCTLLLVVGASGCAHRRSQPMAGEELPRKGDEIVVAGRLFHTGTRVVTWLDPSGYDAYRVERRFSSLTDSTWEASKTAVPALTTPNRYGLRKDGLSAEQLERVRGGGWDLELLREKVDQFVLHFDASGTSRQCFKVLHDHRCLSVHFMLDLDGTIYQTLDLKERAWHATTSNSRSVGIEISNIGAFGREGEQPMRDWYHVGSDGWPRVVVPSQLGEPGFLTPGFVPRPARREPVRGRVQGQDLVQYDFTPQQYAALAKLTATLCRVFPKIRADYPKDAKGQLIPSKLEDRELNGFQGVLGHYHIQSNKVDPGPALDWEKVLKEAKALKR